MRILVIEDNPDIAANLGDYLEDRGHTVDFAADGVTGLHLAVVHEFDAIVHPAESLHARVRIADEQVEHAEERGACQASHGSMPGL